MIARFVVNTEEEEPLQSHCARCRRRVAVRANRQQVRTRAAFSEVVDVYGRRRYYCEPCTREMYEDGTRFG